MIISHTRKFIFVHIPKTAGTTTANVLAPFNQANKPRPWRTLAHALRVPTTPRRSWFEQHDSADMVQKRWGASAFADYYSFSFVRNPFEHAVSHYLFTKDYTFGWPRRKTISDLSFENYLRWRIAAHAHQKLERRTRFVRMPDQSYYVLDKQDTLLVNDIYKTDDFELSMQRLCEKLDITAPETLPHLRRQKKDAGDLLNTESVGLIQKLYDRDFVNFGYSRAP
jgi:hypothetical protein